MSTTTLSPLGLPGRAYSFSSKSATTVISTVVTGVSTRRFRHILAALKNKDMNWAGSFTGVLDVDNPDVYPIILYIDQARNFNLYIDQQKDKTLER